MRSPVLWATVVAAFCLGASVASAAEPRGPEFGNGKYTASIDLAGGPDADDYVATLTAGDRISVTVAAAAKSAVLPTLALVAPDGTIVDPGAKSAGQGKQAVLKTFTATATGKWAVRVGSASGTEGAYTVKFHVTSAKSPGPAKTHVGGADPLVSARAFDAVAGSTVTISVKSTGKAGTAAIRSLTGPDGFDVAGWTDAVVSKGRTSTIRSLSLGDGTGTFRVGVGVDSGDATCVVAITVKPPARPKDSVALRDEPRLTALATPLDGTGGQIARFAGANFSVFQPRPKVWFDDRPATVVAVGSGGTTIDVVAPAAPGDTVAVVTVQNPDGQSATRAALFHYVPQGPLDVASIEPAFVRVAQGAAQQFKVTLTRVPAPPGIDVVLESTAALGALPPFVHVPGNTSSATFTLQAGQTLASGEIRATFASTIAADVGVVPPGTIASISPATVTVTEKMPQTFTLTLSSAAPTAGADVALAFPAALGTAPSTVRVDAGKTTATFVLTAAARRASGTIKATLGGEVTSSVTVLPPATLDVSGWTIVQQNSSLTYTIPQGTVLAVTDCIVVGRNATQNQFLSAWNTIFNGQVHYFTGNGFPDIDGLETMQIKDAAGNSVDGPTIQMATNGGYIYGRNAGAAANYYPGWLAYFNNGSQGGLPGSGQMAASNYPGLYVSKFGDGPVGSYDFVEIYLDQLP